MPPIKPHIGEYFNRKRQLLQGWLEYLEDELAKIRVFFQENSYESIKSDFDSFQNTIKSKLYRKDKEYNFKSDLKLAFCFDRHNSLVSLIPIALILASYWTEGFSLLIYTLIFFLEFLLCQHDRVNNINGHFNILDENNIYSAFLYPPCRKTTYVSAWI